MDKPYATVGEEPVQYAGPQLAQQTSETLQIAVFGPQADEVVRSPEILRVLENLNRARKGFSLIAIPSETAWGKASNALVQAVYEKHVLGVIALDRNSSHLAEQIGTKAFVPVLAISSDRMLTSTNIPWIFRLPQGTPPKEAIRCLSEAIVAAGPNREKIRALLGSGNSVAGLRFQSTGELQ